MMRDIMDSTLHDCDCGDVPSKVASQFMKWSETQDCDCDAGPLDFGSKFLKLSLMSAAGFVRQASALVSSSLPGWETFRLRRMCEIPETKCPPKSLGTICWKGCNGATLTQSIRVTNTSGNEQAFTLSATPFTGPGGVKIPINLTPNVFDKLAGGATGTSEASLTIPANLPAGHYRTKIMVTGAYEQHIEVLLCVYSQEQCTLDVSQGDIPTHIRAHRWYHHFQCVEPCFPPAKRQPSEPVVYPIDSIDSR
jgi:hypothetical protein